jgi:hypothetical protein
MGAAHLQLSGAAALATTVYAVHAADLSGGGCATGESFSFPVTAGAVDVKLPYGAWKFASIPVLPVGAASATLAAGSTPTVTVTS